MCSVCPDSFQYEISLIEMSETWHFHLLKIYIKYFLSATQPYNSNIIYVLSDKYFSLSYKNGLWFV